MQSLHLLTGGLCLQNKQNPYFPRILRITWPKPGNILGVEKWADQIDADASLVGKHGEIDFKGDAKFAKLMKKGDFAKSKPLSEHQFLLLFSVRDSFLKIQ